MSRLLQTRRGYDSEEDLTNSEDDSLGSYSTGEENETDSELEVTDSEYDSDSEEETGNQEVEQLEEPHVEEEKVETVVIQPKDEPKVHVNEGSKDEKENEDIKLPAAEDSIPTEEIQYEMIKEKRIQEHREYRRKLAEDPSFVPYVGLFWSHDDRYREDSFAETRPASSSEASSKPHFNPNPHQTKSNYDQSMDPLMYKKWDHSGYEEILREEEANERRRRNMSELDDQTEIKSYTHKHNFSQRGRGHRGGRGGYQNNGHRQHRPKDNWPDLNSSTKIAKVVENNSWANVTPETLQEHGKITVDSTTVAEDILVDVATAPVINNKPVVSAWGSVDRLQESETLGNAVTVETQIQQPTNHVSHPKKSPVLKNDYKDSNEVAESDGWGAVTQPDWKSIETTVQQDWKSIETQDWNANSTSWVEISQPAVDKQSTHLTQSKHTSSRPVDSNNWGKNPATKNEIPIEEKASSSWAKMSANAPPEKPFIKPSFQNKYESNDKPRHRSYKNMSGNFIRNEDQNLKEDKPWDPSAESSGWSTPIAEVKTQTTESTNGWGESKVTESNIGWEETKVTESKDGNGWGEAATKKVEVVSWDTEKPVEKPVVQVTDVSVASTTTSRNASPAIVESSPSWTVEEQPKARRMGWEDQPKTRADGWSTSQSNISIDWNSDKKANQARFNYNKEPKKSRGYFSQKTEVPSPPVVEEEYQLDDEDSDVEIILEADEEPDWVKNEQILGMTAPKEKESPIVKSYSSSPQPEVNLRKNNNTNYKPRRHFDDNWRQRDEVNSDVDEQQQQQQHQSHNVPMYYPQPHHQLNGGNITYLPMIPNGSNGSPMYAMPYPMGMPSSPVAVSTSPNNSVGGDSSPHMNPNTKFYPPFIHGPNGLQLPPGYEANGMVYYGMDPSAMYTSAPPQPYYYYAPMPATTGPMYSSHRSSPNHPEEQDEEDGWGPLPDVEEQWNTINHTSLH
ncbi:hypothetical protein BDF21DRAFT_457627 [Thamnidium elegans]|nr:hypothetical protein BDF21DRAFT_457627 [Thamnidium elegans]